MRASLDLVIDRLNPILVKEVRQAVRGRYFKVSYGLTLGVATIIAVMILAMSSRESSDMLGRGFFSSIYACMAAALFFWVPFFAFLAMGTEWEENTFDLLVLSDLKPRRIVYGKLWSSSVQTLVYFSAFGPFLVFAFLMQGVDLVMLLLILGGSLVYSLSLSLIAIGVSSLSRMRFVRISLMSLTAAGLVFATVGAIAFATQMSFGITGTTAWQETALIFGFPLSAMAVLGLFLGEVACVRMGHPEENQSTGLRLMTLGVVAIALGWLYFGLRYSYDAEMLTGIGMACLFFLLVPQTFFATEPERLGRRVSHHVPAGSIRALFSSPFLPGGGRGMLFSLGCTLLVLASLFAMQFQLVGHIGSWQNNGMYAVLGAATYCLLYLATPAGLMARRSDSLVARTMARGLVPTLALLAFLLPTLVLFFVGVRADDIIEHPGCMPWILDRLWDDKGSSRVMFFGGALPVLMVVLSLNARRMLRGIREVQAASAARRAREREAAAAMSMGDAESMDASGES